MWETNFVHDLTSFKLYELEARGKGSTNVSFVLADGTMHSHIVGNSGRPLQEGASPRRRHACACGRRRGLFAAVVRGRIGIQGISLAARLHVHAAVLDVPPALQYVRRSRRAISPAVSAAGAIRSSRCGARAPEGGGSLSVQQGGRQIEYEDQDPRIHRKWLEAIRKTGVKSEMGDVFDEPAILALPPKRMTGVIQTPRSIGPAAT